MAFKNLKELVASILYGDLFSLRSFFLAFTDNTFLNFVKEVQMVLRDQTQVTLRGDTPFFNNRLVVSVVVDRFNHNSTHKLSSFIMNDVFWALKPGFGLFALINDLILLNPLTLLVSELKYITSYLTSLSLLNLFSSIYTKIILGFNTLCHLLIAQDLMLTLTNARVFISNYFPSSNQSSKNSNEVYINSNS
jgi:hypothetical protein